MDESTLKEQFAIEMILRCAPNCSANIEAGGFDTGVRVENADRKASERFAVDGIVQRYRAENLPFADAQTVAELRTHNLLDAVLDASVVGEAVTFADWREYKELEAAENAGPVE